MKTKPTSIAQGQSGVYRVVAELIARGHVPYLPVVDTGVDILLGSGVRLQVKTTQRPTQHWRTIGRWSFTLTKSQKIVKKRYVSATPRKFSEEVDFIILHAIEANRFWIVPAIVLDGMPSLNFGDNLPQWKPCDVEEAKRLRAEGRSYQAIGEILGASHHTVMRRLTGRFVTPKRRYRDIPQYESRWDLITGALATLREANQVVNESAPVAVVDRDTFLRS